MAPGPFKQQTWRVAEHAGVVMRIESCCRSVRRAGRGPSWSSAPGDGREQDQGTVSVLTRRPSTELQSVLMHSFYGDEASEMRIKRRHQQRRAISGAWKHPEAGPASNPKELADERCARMNQEEESA